MKNFDEFMKGSALLEQMNFDDDPKYWAPIRSQKLVNITRKGGVIDMGALLQQYKDDNNVQFVDDIIKTNASLRKFLRPDFRSGQAVALEYFGASIFKATVEQGDGKPDTVFYDFVDGNEYVSVKASGSAKHFYKIITTASPTKLQQYVNFILNSEFKLGLAENKLMESLKDIYKFFRGTDGKLSINNLGGEKGKFFHYEYYRIWSEELLKAIKGNKEQFIFKLLIYLTKNKTDLYNHIFSYVDDHEDFDNNEMIAAIKSVIKDVNKIQELPLKNTNTTMSILAIHIKSGALIIKKTKPRSIFQIATSVTNLILGINGPKIKTSWGSGGKQLTIQNIPTIQTFFPKDEFDYQAEFKPYVKPVGYEHAEHILSNIQKEFRKKILGGEAVPKQMVQLAQSMLDVLNNLGA